MDSTSDNLPVPRAVDIDTLGEIIEGEVVDEDYGFKVYVTLDPMLNQRGIKVTITDEWIARAGKDRIDRLGAIRDALFDLAKEPV